MTREGADGKEESSSSSPLRAQERRRGSVQRAGERGREEREFSSRRESFHRKETRGERERQREIEGERKRERMTLSPLFFLNNLFIYY